MLGFLAPFRQRWPWLDKCLKSLEAYTSLADQWGLLVYVKPVTALVISGAVVMWTWIGQSWLPLALAGGLAAFVSIMMLPSVRGYAKRHVGAADPAVSCSLQSDAGGLWRLFIYNDGPDDTFHCSLDFSQAPMNWSGHPGPEATAAWGINEKSTKRAIIERFSRAWMPLLSSNFHEAECVSVLHFWDEHHGSGNGFNSLSWRLGTQVSGEKPRFQIAAFVWSDANPSRLKVLIGIDGSSAFIISSEVPLRRSPVGTAS